MNNAANIVVVEAAPAGFVVIGRRASLSLSAATKKAVRAIKEGRNVVIVHEAACERMCQPEAWFVGEVK